MNGDENDLTKAFLASLPDRMKAAEKEAMRRCGLSDTLYEELVQASYASMLKGAPDAEKAKVEFILRARGYDPDFTPYEAGEGECDMTGIEIDFCPCGRHP